MKDRFKESIKANAYTPLDNPTFTPRVLNRLPQRRRSCRWILPAAFAASFVILIIYAIGLKKGNHDFSDTRILIATIALITYGLLMTLLQPLLRRIIS